MMSEILNDEGIAAIKERLSRATPGPWKQCERWVGVENHVAFVAECFGRNVDYKNDKKSISNAKLIAAAPTDIAILLATVEAQAREIEELKAFNNEAKDMIRQMDREHATEIMRISNIVWGLEEDNHRLRCNQWRAVGTIKEPDPKTGQVEKPK